MKYITASRALLFGLASVLLSSQLAFAQPADGPESGPRHPHRMIETLALDDSQQDLWRAIHQGTREGRKVVRDLQRQLQSLVRSDEYSDARAQALSEQIGEAMAANLLARANAEHAFYQSLNAEQKQTFESSNRREFGPQKRGKHQ